MKTDKDECFVTIDQHVTTAVLKLRTRTTSDADSGASDGNVGSSLALAEVDGVIGSVSEGDGARLLAE